MIKNKKKWEKDEDKNKKKRNCSMIEIMAEFCYDPAGSINKGEDLIRNVGIFLLFYKQLSSVALNDVTINRQGSLKCEERNGVLT
jgi:hypothetical protein